MTSNKTVLINSEDGFDSVKSFCFEFARAMETGAETLFQVNLCNRSVSTGFDEKSLASSSLEKSIVMLEPVLKKVSHIAIQVVRK